MKLVTTISENNSVNIKRFENDICVGERNIRLLDYCKGLLEPLPMGAIFEHLHINISELEDYLKELNEPENFDEFLLAIFNNLSTTWYNENPSFLRFLTVAFNRLNTIEPNNPYVTDFLSAIIKNVKEISLEDNMATLVYEILKRLLKENNTNNLEKKKIELFKAIVSTLESEHKEELKNAIYHLIPHMDNKWFKEMMEKALEARSEVMPYFNGTIPPGVAYLGVNSHGTSYVYELPKAKIRVKYHDVPIEEVGHPRMLAIYKLKGEKVSSMKLVAVKEHEEIHDQMDVYRYPYSHVFNNGSVCWSGYSSFKKDMLPHIANIFLSTSNSNHGVDCLKLYKENEGKDFDDSKLKLLGKLEELL